jgi:hypothetical protein
MSTCAVRRALLALTDIPVTSTKLTPQRGNFMKKLIAVLFAAMFAAVSFQAVAQDKAAKKPSAEECKKDPKMKGCEPAKK